MLVSRYRKKYYVYFSHLIVTYSYLKIVSYYWSTNIYRSKTLHLRRWHNNCNTTWKFEMVEKKLTAIVDVLGKYYKRNHLKSNLGKTQVCAFHLRNRWVSRTLKIYWDEMKLTNTQRSKYLGVTLDRSLTYIFPCENTK